MSEPSTVCWFHLEDHPIYKPFRPFGRGITPVTVGDLGKPWLLTTYKSWDDPPSGGYLGGGIHKDIAQKLHGSIFTAGSCVDLLTW